MAKWISARETQRKHRGSTSFDRLMAESEKKPRIKHKEKKKRSRRKKSAKARLAKFRSNGKSYPDYLKTRHWKQFRDLALSSANHKCSTCSRTQCRLEVHHKPYDRLFRERFIDVEVLCCGCHSLKHEDKSPARDYLSIQFRRIFGVEHIE